VVGQIFELDVGGGGFLLVFGQHFLQKSAASHLHE